MGLLGSAAIKHVLSQINSICWSYYLSILDNSKLSMYNFHYEYIKKKYGIIAKLLFTDTDSLCYHIETEDIYKDFNKDSNDRFDFSNYENSY